MLAAAGSEPEMNWSGLVPATGVPFKRRVSWCAVALLFANPVGVPAYSVVRVDLNSPAVASEVSSASYASGPVAPREIAVRIGPGVADGRPLTDKVYAPGYRRRLPFSSR